MPLHIPIYVNDKLIKTYHIGRFEGEATEDSLNTYIIVQDDQFWKDGIAFTHRYGDGVDTCVTKGLYAMMNK